MDFKEKLQFVRKERGLSQEEVAEAVGVSRQAVAKWESGQGYPDIANLVVLSDLFGVSIDRLVKTTVTHARLSWPKIRTATKAGWWSFY